MTDAPLNPPADRFAIALDGVRAGLAAQTGRKGAAWLLAMTIVELLEMLLAMLADFAARRLVVGAANGAVTAADCGSVSAPHAHSRPLGDGEHFCIGRSGYARAPTSEKVAGARRHFAAYAIERSGALGSDSKMGALPAPPSLALIVAIS